MNAETGATVSKGAGSETTAPAPVDFSLRSDRRVELPVTPNATIAAARLSPDGTRVAYARSDGGANSIWVCDLIDSDSLKGQEPSQLVDLEEWTLDDLGWSPNGNHIAYAVHSSDPLDMRQFVGYCASDAGHAAGELRRSAGTAFAWTTTGKSILVAAPRYKALERHTVDEGNVEILAPLKDDALPSIPVRIVPNPDGKRIAFSCRRLLDDIAEVWIVSREETPPVALLTEVPGAMAHVSPFWSPQGKSLGLHIVHETVGRTGIVIVAHLKGEGEIVYEVDGRDPPIPPAWSPGGHVLACFCRSDDDGHHLMLLNPKTRTQVTLGDLAHHPGALRWMADGRLICEGRGDIRVIEFESSL